MHPKMTNMLSNLHFTPAPLAMAKPEPKSSVINQSMVIAPPAMNMTKKTAHFNV